MERAKRASNLQAYLKILEGIAYANESKFSEARKAFEEALSVDQNSPAYGWVAWMYLMDVWFGPTAGRAQSLGKAFEYAEKCLELDDSNEGCNRTLGHAYLLKRDYEKALYYGRRSIEMNPNSAKSATIFGWTLRCVGRYEEAIQQYERAMRLDPRSIQMPLTQLGTTYVMMRRHEEAIEACRKSAWDSTARSGDLDHPGHGIQLAGSDGGGPRSGLRSPQTESEFFSRAFCEGNAVQKQGNHEIHGRCLAQGGDEIRTGSTALCGLYLFLTAQLSVKGSRCVTSKFGRKHLRFPPRILSIWLWIFLREIASFT